MATPRKVWGQWLVAPYTVHQFEMKSLREARCAQLLGRLVHTGDVFRWWYEPHGFRCKRMYRRERIYWPDFLVVVNPETDVFNTGTRSVWIEVKAKLDQNGKTRFHCLTGTYPFFKRSMLLMVDSNPAGRRSKTAARQRALQDGAMTWIRRVIYATDWYPKFGIT